MIYTTLNIGQIDILKIQCFIFSVFILRQLLENFCSISIDWKDCGESCVGIIVETGRKNDGKESSLDNIAVTERESDV